jgi:hypothetical protein
VSDEAVHGLALRRHGAPLGRRDAGCDLGEVRRRGARRQAVAPELQRRDEGAVDEEVGVAPDRRGEVGVFRQVQAEVADVLGVVLGLHLGAQDHLVDDGFVRPLAHLLQQPVEPLGLWGLALAPDDA